MFDIGFFELVLLAIVGLLVLGPERLPHAVRMTTAYLGKIRRAVLDVREEFEREVNIQEMQQRIKDQVKESGLSDTQQSLAELQKQIEDHHDIGGSSNQEEPKQTIEHKVKEPPHST